MWGEGRADDVGGGVADVVGVVGGVCVVGGDAGSGVGVGVVVVGGCGVAVVVGVVVDGGCGVGGDVGGGVGGVCVVLLVVVVVVLLLVRCLQGPWPEWRTVGFYHNIGTGFCARRPRTELTRRQS